MPSSVCVGGMRMSVTTTSGDFSVMLAISVPASAAVPTSSISAEPSRTCVTASRTRKESSATTTRMGVAWYTSSDGSDTDTSEPSDRPCGAHHPTTCDHHPCRAFGPLRRWPLVADEGHPMVFAYSHFMHPIFAALILAPIILLW